jgi:hypothetical protein
MKCITRIAAATAVLCVSAGASASSSSPTVADADESTHVADGHEPESSDPMFPRAGGFGAAAASGIPFLALGELSYGFTDRFALGAIAAATPDMGSIPGTMAFGLRPRGVVFASGPWRSVVAVPVLFYPKVDGFGHREPWMLARPTWSLEYALPSGAFVYVAAGVVGVACVDGIVTLGKEHTMVGGVWETGAIGASIPLSRRTNLFGEASLITRGVEPAPDWVGGLPVVTMIGVATRL